MTNEHFAHMLKLSTVFISVMQSRALFDDIDEMTEADKHNSLNCLEIVADTFVEMQRRLGVKPMFRVRART
jgi:hypothetical protein